MAYHRQLFLEEFLFVISHLTATSASDCVAVSLRESFTTGSSLSYDVRCGLSALEGTTMSLGGAVTAIPSH